MALMGYESTFKYKLIYIMTIRDDDHDGFLKIGEATLDSTLGASQLTPNCDALNAAAHSRIKEYTKTALVKYELLYTELAIRSITMSDGSVMPSPFSDNDIHDVLARSNYLCKKFPDTDRDSEWYNVDLETAINAIKAYKEGRNSLSKSEKGSADKFNGQGISHEFKLREEQQAAVNKARAVFKNNDKMLWDCKMRFGKTVSAYELIREGKFQKTIIVTHRPVVETGWQSDHDLVFGENSQHLFVTKKIHGSTYEYDASIDSENDRILRNYNRMGISFAYFASMQDLRGSKIAGGKFDKNHAVFELDWDLIIYDEAHEGTQTDLGQSVMEQLERPKEGKTPKVLSLSGTPYNLFNQYEDDNVYTWDYVDEQERKREFAEHFPDEYNPYADLPEMRILTFDLQKAMSTAYRYENEDMAFNFREFFRTWTGDPVLDFRPIPNGAEIGDFVHEEDVKNFLDLITTESKDSNYPFSNQAFRDMFKHTFWMVPGVKEAKALSKLLRNHDVFKNYKIANVAGEGDKEKDYDNALAEVKAAIKGNPYTITISCGRLTTGVTVPEWSAVMMLTGSASTSAAGYMQTIFRVQSVGSIDGKQKEVAYVFDFAPDRALKVLAEVHSLSNKGKRGDSSAKNALGEFLNFCPVIAVEGTHMTEYDVPHMMRQIKKITVDKAIKSGFEDDSIYNEGVGIIMNDADVKLFNLLAQKIHGQGKSKLPRSVTINKQGLTSEEYRRAEQGKNKPRRERTKEEIEAIKKQKEMRKEQEKVLRLLRAVSIRLPLLIYGAKVDISESIRMEDFVDIVDDISWLEFMPQNITKDLFKSLLKYYDEDVIVAAGYRIRHMAKAADELPPTKRVQRIAEIFSLFRNPDKETVLTPWRVVNMHLGDMIGGYNFYDVGYPVDNQLTEPRLIDDGEITDNLFLNPEVKFLEMNSKSGLYPLYLTYSIYAMKLPEPESQMNLEDTQKIWKETLEENIFVLCKTKMAVSITRRTLAGYQDNWEVYAICLPHLLERMEDHERLGRKLTNPKTWGKDGDRMKFDAIVGNPPYQVLDGGGRGYSAKPVYNMFVEQAITMNPHYISMITPSRWFSGGKGLDDFRANMLNDTRLCKIVDFVDNEELFKNVAIAGGVNYFLWDRDHKGNCEVTSIRGDKKITMTRNLAEYDIFIRNNESIQLMKRVVASGDDMMDNHVYTRNVFGIASDFRGQETKDSTHTIALFCSQKSNSTGITWIEEKDVVKQNDLLSKYKVIIGKVVPRGGEVGIDPKIGYRVITTVQLLGPNSAFTDSYLLLSVFDTQEEALNFTKYMTLKFPRFMLHETYSSMNISKNNFKFVPFLDYHKEWTDDMLFERYNCSDSEIEMIDSMIRPLEYVAYENF